MAGKPSRITTSITSKALKKTCAAFRTAPASLRLWCTLTKARPESTRSPRYAAAHERVAAILHSFHRSVLLKTVQRSYTSALAQYAAANLHIQV